MLFLRRLLIFLGPAPLALSTALVSGCASMGHDSRAQAVLVQSDPPGASVFQNGKQVGTTPLYALVRREKHPELTLSREGESKRIRLDSKYRWNASFFSNFAFYIFAPIGWTVDLLDGSAWSPLDPGIVSFRNDGLTPNEKNLQAELPPPSGVVIAPPKAASLEMSNAAVPVLKEALIDPQRKSHVHLLPYEQTLPLFLKRGFDYDADNTDDDKRMLYHSLDAPAIWHSTFARDGEALKLHAELEDTRTHVITDQVNLTLDATDERSRAYAQGFHLFQLPNAVSLSLTNQNMSYTADNNTSVSLRPAEPQLWWAKGLQYLSAFSISRLPDYRPDRAGRWSFNFFPTLRFSHQDIVAHGNIDADGQLYSRWLIGLGYGPELGYQSGKHYYYFDLTLYGAWSQISWNMRGQDYWVANTGLQTTLELGYLYSFNNLWSVRLFAANLPELSDVWQQALNASSKTTLSSSPGAAANSMTGISVGFSYEPFFQRHFKHKMKKAPSNSTP